MNYVIEIPEVHKAIIEVEAPEGLSRQEILALAKKKFEENGSDILEYSRTLEEEEWVTRTDNGEFIN